MKLSYVLIALVVLAMLIGAFAGGYFVGRTNAPFAANYAYGLGAMMRGFGGNGVVPGFRPGTGMMDRFGRGNGMMNGYGRGFGSLGFFPGLGLLGIGFRFLAPLAFLALIVLVVILLVRKSKPAAVAPVTAAPPTETKQA
ncbi:MAG: hypothetical protein KGJ80_04370 [Chloroflexota bacterium]|nr:hypothetical protein [Chloroflexota bacterium]